MATSGTNLFKTTEYSIIQDAMIMIGVVDQNEAIDAGDYAKARRMLNMLIKFLSIKANLWVTKEVTFTLTAGTSSYTVGNGLDIDTPRPLRLDHARRTDSANAEIPMSVISRQDYMELPNKTVQSPCTQVYYDPQLSHGILYVWGTGDTNNKDITLTFKRPLEDFTAQGQNPDLPDEWNLPLVTMLAEKLAPSYLGAVPTWLQAEATNMIRIVIEFDEEDTSLSFAPRNQ